VILLEHASDLLGETRKEKYGKKKPLGNVLKRSARKEFEAGRHEMDHAIILKLLITGRTALQQAEEAMEKRRATLLEERSQKKV